MLEVFSEIDSIRFELGTHVNHAIEFWPETIKALKKLKNVGFRIYNQNPLLKGVNDNLETLIDLYTALRDNDIESHYLFMLFQWGMSHHKLQSKKDLIYLMR